MQSAPQKPPVLASNGRFAPLLQLGMRAARLAYRELYLRKRYGRFYQLKREAGGMLHPAVYEKLYQLVKALPDHDIVEIGGAGGAGSVAIGWAMKESGKRSKLVVVEKCEGGSRSELGGYQENLERIQAVFEKFGVAEHVVLFPHELNDESADRVLGLLSGEHIAALIHDADGRIDRDFGLFWPRLQPGGLIVVDDYENTPEKYKPVSLQHPTGGAKTVITYRLLNQLTSWGLFEKTFQKGTTVFGRKPAEANFTRFDRANCEGIVESVLRERDRALQQAGH